MVMGLVWFLAASGVYVRDIGQAVPAVTTALLFLSPILFPAATLPHSLQLVMKFNPLTVPVEQVRRAVIYGVRPDLQELAIYSVAALIVAIAGHAWFQRCRGGFADAL
jgi:lipopolysaccharide transport system permease protein